jgi:N-acetylmuramoyl-L-alanine amidase
MRVGIDPGHGMSNRQRGIYDPGATHVENGFRYEEATIVLKYGLVLKDIF